MAMQVLMGMIASGKSTYCKERAAEGAIIINDDSIVTAVHGGDYTLYSKSLKPLYKSIESTIIHTAVSMGRDVIIDRTGFSIDQRRRYVGIGKSLGITVSAIVFPREDPIVHARRRFESDPRGHSLEKWIEAAMHHHEMWEEPNRDLEGFDSVVYRQYA